MTQKLNIKKFVSNLFFNVRNKLFLPTKSNILLLYQFHTTNRISFNIVFTLCAALHLSTLDGYSGACQNYSKTYIIMFLVVFKFFANVLRVNVSGTGPHFFLTRSLQN